MSTAIRTEEQPQRTESSPRSRRERNALIERKIGLAQRIAADYTHRGIERDDLEQVALLALVKAADRFDETKGTRFGAFASRTINGEIKRYFRDHGWSVRPPRSVQESYLDVRRCEESLSQELGRSPTVDELADRSGRDPDEVLEALAAQGSYRARPMDARAPDGSATRSFEPASPDIGYETIDDEIIVADLTDDLTERERLIVHLRFWDEQTQSEIAQRVGVSQVQVSRLLRRIRTGLRQAVDAGVGDAPP